MKSIQFFAKHKVLSCSVFFLLAAFPSYSQLYAGGGFGTFSKGFGNRGLGPTVSIMYSQDILEQSAFFLNTSLYKKSGLQFGNVDVYNNLGMIVGSAKKMVTINTTHFQFGFLRNLGDKENSPKPNFFIGTGIVLSKVNATYNYNLDGETVASDNVSNSIFGFHFSLGVHSQIKKMVLELRGSFDFMLKKDIAEYSVDESLPRVSSTRVSLYYPLTK